jgi:hypothetical protein
MIERVHLGILVNESQSMVMFPMITKKESAKEAGGARHEEHAMRK